MPVTQKRMFLRLGEGARLFHIMLLDVPANVKPAVFEQAPI
jgi:hypothetical protein